MIGILLAQIGTPVAPTPEAVKRYLRRFLGDPRIVDYPRWLWSPILEMILLTRPKKVAAAYEEIWTAEGSPLWATSRAQARLLQEKLGKHYQVELGLSYTTEDIEAAYKKLITGGCQRIIVLPLFPEFSSSTTTAAYDAVSAAALGRNIANGKGNKGYIPPLTFLSEFCGRKDYQKMLADHVKEQLADLPERPDHVLISFHGIPVRYEKQGDPYRTHCELTAHTLGHNLAWLPMDLYNRGVLGSAQSGAAAPDPTDAAHRDAKRINITSEPIRYTIAFQSQFGPEQWLKPSTQALMKELPRRGIERLAVITPGFVTDCIETLEEIACEGRELWVSGGGNANKFHHIPCLNDSERFINMLAGWIKES